jgi:integrase
MTTESRKELSARGINALPIPTEEERLADYADGRIPGLTLRVFASGRRSWYLKYRQDGKQRRYKLGDYPTLGLKAARKEAEALRVGVRNGADPVRERRDRQEAETVGDLFKLYLSEYAKDNLAPTTLTERTRILNGSDTKLLRGMIAAEVEPADVARVLDKIERRGKRTMLNRTQVALSAVFTWASIRRRAGVIQNPVKALPRRFTEKARDRALDKEEIRLAWEDLGKRTVGAPTAIQLVLLTAQRPGEVSAMQWAHLDTDANVWRMPEGYRKKPRGEDVAPPHEVPLSDLALTMLSHIRETNEKERRVGRRKFVFPSESKAGHLLYNGLSQSAQRVVAKLGMERWTPHDLRRTATTWMTKLGHPRLIVDKVLGHKDTSVAGIYDRHSYWDERVAAVNEWGAKLSEIVEDDASG